MKKFITILITSFLIPLIINASTIHFVDNNRELFIRGNKDIGFYFSNPDSLMDIIRNEGYLDVNYTITNDTLFVSTGKQFLLQQIVYDNDDTVTVDPPVPFIQKSVSKTISTYLYQERETGNLFADYKITDVQMSGNTITLFLQKNEGPKIKLNDIRFKGLTRTDQNAIRKYFLIDSNVVITPLLLNNIEKQAEEIPFLLFTPPVEMNINPGYKSSDILVSFKEKPKVLLNGGGGYISEDKSFVWSMDLSFENLFGDGRQVKIQSEKKNKNRQFLEIKYRQPQFFFGRGEWGIDLNTRDYRADFYEFSVGGFVHSQLR